METNLLKIRLITSLSPAAACPFVVSYKAHLWLLHLNCSFLISLESSRIISWGLFVSELIKHVSSKTSAGPEPWKVVTPNQTLKLWCRKHNSSAFETGGWLQNDCLTGASKWGTSWELKEQNCFMSMNKNGQERRICAVFNISCVRTRNKYFSLLFNEKLGLQCKKCCEKEVQSTKGNPAILLLFNLLLI